MVLAALILLGYIVSYPVFAWTYTDLRRSPRHLWTGYGRPHPWRQATVLSYLGFGLPVLVVALVWRTGTTRAQLRATAHGSRSATSGSSSSAPQSRTEPDAEQR
jgi:hypothetical protein